MLHEAVNHWSDAESSIKAFGTLSSPHHNSLCTDRSAKGGKNMLTSVYWTSCCGIYVTLSPPQLAEVTLAQPAALRFRAVCNRKLKVPR